MSIGKRFTALFLRLPALMVAVSVGVALLMALALGLPGLWLAREQFDRQAWARVDSGAGTVRALLDARQNELDNLALVTAQRPTLYALLEGGDDVELSAYLQDLQSSSGLDLLLICGPLGQQLGQAGLEPPGPLCAAPPAAGFYRASAGEGAPVWLLSVQPVQALDQPLDGAPPEDVGAGTLVIAGLALNGQFLEELRSGTGLELALLLDGQVEVSSLAGSLQSLQTGLTSAVRGESLGERSRFDLESLPYYAVRFPLQSPWLETAVLLPAPDIIQARGRITNLVAATILSVAALGTLLGVFFSNRLSRPLADLGRSARALRRGDLTTPIRAGTRVREVAQLAYALEDARVSLLNGVTELRQEKAWTDHLLESVVEGILTLDSQNRITFFSQGAERITGWKAAEVLGLSCDRVFQPAEQGQLFSRLIPPAGGRSKIPVVLAGGKNVTLSITGALLAPPQAGRARVVLVLRDVSDEEAVRRFLGDFLADITHEFRTPLSALAASVELLLEGLPDLSEAEVRQLLDSTHLGILGLQTLIDNLLEGASLETGRFRVYPRPTDLGVILDETAATMLPLMARYGQTLSLDLPPGLPQVQADPRRTAQVLVNLLSNAVKYGSPGSPIELAAQLDGPMVRVQVADCGTGIPVEARGTLFHRFSRREGEYRLNEPDRRADGVGLGLSVVKAIVEAQGGQVGVEDRPGGGAVFWFTLKGCN